jgi:hypothetical protein
MKSLCFVKYYDGAESRTRTDDLLITNPFLAVLQDVV